MSPRNNEGPEPYRRRHHATDLVDLERRRQSVPRSAAGRTIPRPSGALRLVHSRQPTGTRPDNNETTTTQRY